MIVVSDTTPLSTLFLIDKLYWLKEIFGSITIPQSVYFELSNLARYGHDISIFHDSDWIIVESVSDPKKVAELLEELDLGESEAIVLAVEKRADLLLIDERKGSQIATEMGVRTAGLLRFLIELKQRGIITEVKSVLQDIRSTGGFWMSERLFQRVLEEAGE